jgi:hypothetical protein
MHRHEIFPNNDLISHYRRTFSSGYGKEVLDHMLFDLGAFIEVSPDDVAEKALQNYAIRLLSILAGGEIGKDSIDAFTKQLMRQPLPKEQVND